MSPLGYCEFDNINLIVMVEMCSWIPINLHTNPLRIVFVCPFQSSYSGKILPDCKVHVAGNFSKHNFM